MRNVLKSHLIFLTMVTTMVTINTILVYGFSMHDVLIILQLLVIVIPGAFILKELFTIPLVKNIETKYLMSIRQNVRRMILFPAMVMLINSGIITMVSTILKNIGEFPLLTNFLEGWGIKLAILFPLFFFVVRPLWNYIFDVFETAKID